MFTCCWDTLTRTMQVPFCYVIVLGALITSMQCAPLSYQYVKFVRDGGGTATPAPTGTISRRSGYRPSRSFRFSSSSSSSSSLSFTPKPIHLSEDDIIGQSLVNSVTLDHQHPQTVPDYFTDFDPYLITGPQAKRIAATLYRKPLFFEEVHHVDALLKNQERRRSYGLAGNILGSLRPYSPFYRFKNNQYRYL